MLEGKTVYISLLFFLCNGIVSAQSLKINPYNYQIKKNIECRNGAVVSAHTLASEVGVQILKEGGNAFDAIVATQLALAVVYPSAGNIGGGGFLVGHLKNGKNISIDYREIAPAAASRDMYLDANGNPITTLSLNGHLSAGVPGTIAGLFVTIKYAKLSFKKLIQPAIDLAEKGFVLTERLARTLNDSRENFVKLNFKRPAFVKDELWKAGDTLIQKDLANTLKRISDFGAKGFYEGETAKLIVEEMKKGNGIITKKDLKNYKPKQREPVIFSYKGYTILTMPLPSSGGIILQQMMKMTEDRNIASLGFQTLQSVQLMTEIERRAYADRAKYLGDPDFVNVPEKTLVNKKYLGERMKDYKPGEAGNSEVITAGNIKESDQTTHISVIDREGNAVSVTTTLNNSYGSKTVVGGAGFLLNDEMDDFSVKPGVPNMYGAIGNEKNAIAPGKRMLSSMTPTIVLKNKNPYIIVGANGGTTITTSIYQSLINLIEFKLNPDDAINKPRFHHQWLPDKIDVEKDFPETIKTGLSNMGYKVNERSFSWRSELIKISPNKKIAAVADKRGDDHAAGYNP